MLSTKNNHREAKRRLYSIGVAGDAGVCTLIVAYLKGWRRLKKLSEYQATIATGEAVGPGFVKGLLQTLSMTVMARIVISRPGIDN